MSATKDVVAPPFGGAIWLNRSQKWSRRRRTSGFPPASRPADDDRVHCTGARAADGVECEVVLFEQAVTNAPGESAQRTPALKGKRDALRGPAYWFRVRAPGDRLRATWETGLADRVVGPEINLLILDRSPEPLDEDVVAPGALAVHADPDARPDQHSGELVTGELRALIAVEDLWPAVPSHGLLDGFDAECDVHGDRQPPGQDLRLNQSTTAVR